MKELNSLEVEQVSGAFFFEIGYAVGSGVEAIRSEFLQAYVRVVNSAYQ